MLYSSTLFLNRLNHLRSICSTTNSDLPFALLAVPGPDGRNNKGSVIVLKYLFFGSTGHDLLEGALESSQEGIEDSIILVTDSSLSIFYT